MKTDISFLPETKQEELKNIVETITTMCDDVLMIILYGSYARNEYKEYEDVDPKGRSGHVSDIDIFVVTEKHSTALDGSLWYKIKEVLMDFRAQITAKSIKGLRDRLKEQHFFYSDIVREGVVLYNPNKRDLEVAETIPDREKARIAKEHLKNWFPQSKVFYKDYLSNMERASTNEDEELYLKQSVFNLHQAAERSLKSLQTIFLNYTGKGHWLYEIESEILEAVPEVADIFPRKTEAEVVRFKNFDNSYIGARYEPDYRISEEDLIYFGERVSLLFDLVEKKWNEYLPVLEAAAKIDRKKQDAIEQKILDAKKAEEEKIAMKVMIEKLKNGEFDGVDISIISKITGLSAEEIETICS
jgi:predicted nucleotidyltransferase/HEPN domain-containing protein